jgi:uncharacterized protein
MKPKDVRVGRSYAGLGLFAGKSFKKDERIIEYIGERISAEEANKRGGKYLFEVSSRTTIDGSARSNVARYINHSCDPNCEAIDNKGRIFIHAMRAIESGEELTYDYGEEYFRELLLPIGCKCPSCRSGNPSKYR